MAKCQTPSQYRLSRAIIALHPHVHPDVSLRLLCEHVLHRLVGWPIDPDQRHYEATLPLVEHYEADLRAHAPFSDLLGEIYMDLASRYSQRSMGQYFTPKPIASLMAAMQSGPAAMPADRMLRVIEPSVGSGVMLLAMLEQVVERHGPRALRQLSLTGIDLDGLCCRMAAAQLLVSVAMLDATLGELMILQGNALAPAEELSIVIHCTAPIEAGVRHGQLAEAIGSPVIEARR